MNESDVRKRNNPAGPDDGHQQDHDEILTEDNIENLVKNLPQSTDSTSESVDSLLAGLPPRWRNWIIRGAFSIVMISGFSALVYMGPVALMFLDFLSILIRYHRFIGFLLYIIGFVWFVLSLRKGYYMRQFSLFAYTHVALFLLVLGAYFISMNILQGIIWFLVPVSMIICNDIMAYMFGFFFGKTSLIELSPKKTWEGFIGGAFSTILFGIVLSAWLCRYDFFICPLSNANEPKGCRLPAFVPQEFNVPTIIVPIMKLLRKSTVIKMKPFLLHAAVMSLFASIVGPFGGFFASGFKRAFKIKDFGAVIPGHGGLMDRFDCQLLMGAFVHMYIQTFIRVPNPAKIVNQIIFLPPDDQLHIYYLLQQKLTETGVLNSTLP